MSALFVVLPLALIVVLAAVIAFAWAARRGQFDDLDTPALRVLHEDEGKSEDLGKAAPPGAQGGSTASASTDAEGKPRPSDGPEVQPLRKQEPPQ